MKIFQFYLFSVDQVDSTVLPNCKSIDIRGGKGGRASLTFSQYTNKIISVFIPDFMSYMEMYRLIKPGLHYITFDTNMLNVTC